MCLCRPEGSEGGAGGGQYAMDTDTTETAGDEEMDRLRANIETLRTIQPPLADGAPAIARMQAELEAKVLAKRLAKPVAAQLREKESFLDRLKKTLERQQSVRKELSEQLAALQLAFNFAVPGR